MKKTLTLDTKQIDSLIEELQFYSDSLELKCKLFVEKLANRGVAIAALTLTSGYGDTPKDVKFAVEVNSEGVLTRGLFQAEGDRLFMWEFGAGNYYNGMTSPNPKAKEFGMGPGTYPGQTHVPDPGYWYYREDGQLYKSYGTQAVMPMYNAYLKMAEEAYEIACEVFGSE